MSRPGLPAVGVASAGPAIWRGPWASDEEQRLSSVGSPARRVGYDRTAGRVVRYIRLVAFAAVVLFTFQAAGRSGDVPLGMALAAGTLLLAASGLSFIGDRFHDRPWARRVTDAELVLDGLYAIVDASVAIPVIGYAALGVPALVVPIEAAFRRGIRVGLGSAVLTGGGIVAGRLLLPDLFLVAPIQAADLVPVVVAPALVAVLLGWAVRARQETADRLEEVNLELREALRWQQDLLSFAAHEVKSPLASVVGALSLLSEHGPSLTDDERTRYLDMAQGAAMNAASTADDMLGRARVAAGALTPTRQRVDVSALVEEICRTARTEGLDVQTDLAAVVVLQSDPTFLRHILNNLLSNAQKYGAPPVRVTLVARPGGAALTVEDSGPGVSVDFVPELFASFTRAPSTTAEGTGVGLHVVLRMARALGGGVRYEAREPNGARFVVDLVDVQGEVRREGSGPGR